MKGSHPLKGHKISKHKIKRYEDASQKIQNIFESCAQQALTGDMRAKHCACLVRKGEMIMIECNHAGNCHGFSTHAEATIHKKMTRHTHNKKKERYTYDLYIIRYSERSGFMNSKPCSECTRLIKNEMYYVNKVIYSYDNKHYIIEHKDTLKTSHISNGTSNFRKRSNC